MIVLSASNRWIPAYAGRTVESGGNDSKRAGDAHKKAAIPRFRGMTAKGVPDGQPPVTSPYFRVWRVVFLQVAVQDRLSRAR